MLFGPSIIARSLSRPHRADRYGNIWQYHPQSDRHSKIACWAIMFDLLRSSEVVRNHAASQRIGFGINHEMADFKQNRRKNLDLVLCRPAPSRARAAHLSFKSLTEKYGIVLDPNEVDALTHLPDVMNTGVASVLMALEAKACMTAHQRALPRLYDELNSSHLTTHGANDHALAVGFVMINASDVFLSPSLNKANRTSNPVWSRHRQPKDTEITIRKVEQLPRRTRAGQEGYDAIGIVVVNCRNDGHPVSIVENGPAPLALDIYSYGQMVERAASLYASRFREF